MIYSIDDVQEAQNVAREGQSLLNRFEKWSIPSVAAIHGSCLGGGFEVTLACTHRVASSHRITQVGLPEVKLGLIPGAGGTVRLTRMIGLQQSLQLILAGSTLSSQKAKALSIIDEILRYDDDKNFFGHVREYAIKLIDVPHKDKYSRRKRSFLETLYEVHLHEPIR